MGRERRLSVPEAAVLILLTAWALGPLVLMLRHVHASGGVFAGSDGPFAADQLQYLWWVRDEGGHFLASNGFDLAPSSHVFLHPMFVLSGLLWKLGLGIQASYLVWKPVALLVLFGGFALFVRRTVEGAQARFAALLVALFYAAPAAAALDWAGATGAGTANLAELLGEALPAGHMWGYLPTAIAVGAMPLYVLAAERALTERSGRPAGWLAGAAVAGAAAAWLHPWQGQVLVLVTLGLMAWSRERRTLLPLLVPLAATLAPILYYLLLGELDSAWEIARRQNEDPHWPLWVLIVGLAPLAALAPLGAAWRSREPIQRALILWPLASLAVYGFLSPSVPSHGFEGISLPLAVLSARAWQRLDLPAPAGALAVAVLTIPGLVFAADKLRDVIDAGTQPHYLRPGEDRAMAALERDGRPGGVIADARLGPAVPALTGRSVWAGHPSWTPGFPARVGVLDEILGGRARGPRAVRLLAGTGARFALAGCTARADLRATAAPAVARARRFGCATVYELRSAP